MQKSDGRVTETAVEARQGFLDRPVLVVLVVSTVLGVLALGVAYLGVLG